MCWYITEPEACYGRITNTVPVDPSTDPAEDPTSGCYWLYGSSLKATIVITLVLVVFSINLL